MNILRWKRKSNKKIRPKTILLFIFSLIMTTFAWFAYSKVLDPTLNIHMASWNITYEIEEEPIENPIVIDIPILSPNMDKKIVTVDIFNNGETKVDIEYEVKSMTIGGIEFKAVAEGSTPTSDNYITIAPPVLETVEKTETTTDEETGETITTTITKQVYKSAITNDISRFPFTIEIEHSPQIDAVTKDLYGGEDTPGQGYLEVTVNWIGDNDRLDSEWGYIVGDYLAKNPDATSAMSIEISINSYQVDPEAGPLETTMPSTASTRPYLPDGYKRVPGTSLTTGLVIEDANGNQYVWVEVPRTTAVYKNAGIDITTNFIADTDNDGKDGYTEIEEDLRNYVSSYSTRVDEYKDYDATGLSIETYPELKKKMLKSIYSHGGFYIGRYETGVEGEPRTRATATTPTTTPVIKATEIVDENEVINVYPYNWVTCSQANTIAGRLSQTGYTTSLLFGVQWDLVLKYLEIKGALEDNWLTTDSTSWGNYLNNSYVLTNPTARHNTSATGWLDTIPYEKKEKAEVLVSSGANSGFCMQNIYDFAGNLSEWTYNVVHKSSNNTYIGGNGGDYLNNGADTPANYYGTYNTMQGVKHVGFRVALISEADVTTAWGDDGVITTITLDKTSAEVVVGDSIDITATLNGEANNNLIWTSSDERIATVRGSGTNKTIGTVTGVSEGTVTITARDEDGATKATCEVTVINRIGGPYLPSGFSWANAGHTEIKDPQQNQYVWISVPRDATVYNDLDDNEEDSAMSDTSNEDILAFNINSLTEDNLTAIETELKEYTATYRDGTTHKDEFYSGNPLGFADETAYNNHKNAMLASVFKNEGFYVGKYETGIADTEPDVIDNNHEARTSSSQAIVNYTPVIQANAYPYNYVTNKQAQELASTKFNGGGYTTSLMFGLQWDLVLKHLEITKVATEDELKSDSTEWGNYNNHIYSITNISAKNYVSTWVDGKYEKKESTSVLLSTGASSEFERGGIYDLAGNVREWTLEYTSNTDGPCACRGGVYSIKGSANPASGRGKYGAAVASGSYGFRVALW